MDSQKVWDVLVVGGGPAGSACALHLVRNGLDVAVIDKRQFPRDKVCGDGLIADSIAYLKRAGLFESVREHAHELKNVSIFSPSSRRLDISGYCLTIRRQVLDDILLSHSQAKILTGKVNRIETDGQIASAFVIGMPEPLRAKKLVIATGADISLLKQCGMTELVKPSALAARCYIRSDYRIDSMVLSYDKSVLPGYAWIFPMKNNEYNVGCGYAYNSKTKNYPDPRKLFQDFCEKFEPARFVMQNAEILSPIQGSVLRYGLRGITPQKQNIVAVGEAIGTTFPFTGEGIGKAMETGELAADLIRKNRIGDYAERLKTDFRPKYLGYELAEKWCSRPWFVELVMKRAQKSEKIRLAISKVLDETLDLRKAFTLRRVAKLVFGRVA